MSIASKIETMQGHVSDIYDTLTLAGSDLTDVNKNIVNINNNLKERLKYYLGNGIDIVWENWEKIDMSGTSLILNNTIKGKMEIKIKPSELYQESTSGYNTFPYALKETKTNSGITIVSDGKGTYTINGTSTNALNISFNLIEEMTIPISIGNNGNGKMYFFNDFEIPSGSTLNFLYNGTVIDSWGLYEKNRTSTTYISMGDKKCNQISFTILSGVSFSNAKISPMFTDDGNTTHDFEPYTNGASPNPDYPQEIYSISGDNTLIMGGENLLPFSERSGILSGLQVTTNNQGYMSITGTANAGTNISYNLSSAPAVLTKGKYKIYAIGDTNNAYYGLYKSGTSNIITVVSSFPFDIILNEDINIQFVFIPTVGNTYNINAKFLITKENEYETYSITLPVENLFDGVLLNGRLNSSGTPTGVSSELNKHSNLLGIKPNTTYTLSSTISYPDVDYYCIWYDNDNNILGSFNMKNLSKSTQTSPNNAKYIAISIYNAEGQTTQLEKSTKANSYSEYGTTPLEYCKIGNYEDEFVMLNGDNFFDKNNTTIGRLYENGTLAVINGYFTSEFIKVEPNMQYTKNSPSADAFHRFAFYSSNTEASFISQSIDNTITTPNNCRYLRFCGIDTEINTTILNEGSITTSYGKWYLKKNIGKIVLDGSETYWRVGSATDRYSFWFNNKDVDAILEPHQKYCNNFLYTSIRFDQAPIPSLCENSVSNPQNTMFIFNTDGTQGTSVGNWKTWLSTHNTIVYYVLAIPTYILLNDTLQEQLENIYNHTNSYNEQTNINQNNNDLPFIIKAKALIEL